MHFKQHFDFRMDAGDGPEHVFDIDETIVINQDGTGRLLIAGKKEARTFDVSDDEIDDIKGMLDQMDLAQVSKDFPVGPGDPAVLTISYGGATALIGDAFFDDGGRPVSDEHRRLDDLIALVERPASATQ